MKNVICPISNVKIPEHLPRVTAFYNILLMGIYMINPNVILLAFIGIEFLLRGFEYQQFSIIHTLSIKTSNFFQFKSRSIDKAPKLFAARLGGVMFIVAFGLNVFGIITGSIVIVSMVILLSTLECILSICVGCYIYHYIVIPIYKE